MCVAQEEIERTQENIEINLMIEQCLIYFLKQRAPFEYVSISLHLALPEQKQMVEFRKEKHFLLLPIYSSNLLVYAVQF